MREIVDIGQGEAAAGKPRPGAVAVNAVNAVNAAARDQTARLRDIVIEHHAFVWRSLVRLGVPRADAEDAVQQVFLVVSRRLADLVPGSERAFLYGVALRTASRARRASSRRREVDEDTSPEPIDEGAQPDQLLDRARARALLDTILTDMPLELRSVFTLFELEQLSTSEISEILGVPCGTVASRLRRAREAFALHRQRIEARFAHRAENAARRRQ